MIAYMVRLVMFVSEICTFSGRARLLLSRSRLPARREPRPPFFSFRLPASTGPVFLLFQIGRTAENQTQSPQSASIACHSLKVSAADAAQDPKHGPKLRRPHEFLPELPHCFLVVYTERTIWKSVGRRGARL